MSTTDRLNQLRSQFADSQKTLASLNKQMKDGVKELPDTPELAYFKGLPDAIAKRMATAKKKGNSEVQGMRIIEELTAQLNKNKSAD